MKSASSTTLTKPPPETGPGSSLQQGKWNRFLEEHAMHVLLGMSALYIWLFINDTAGTRHLGRLAVLGALLFPVMLHSGRYWLAVSGVLIAGLLPALHKIDNHIFLAAYWTFAVAASLFASAPQIALRTNARLLLGLCFLFATLWKLISLEFMRGAFFQMTFLVDARFADFAMYVAGVSGEALATNMERYSGLRDPTSSLMQISLQSAPRVAVLALATAYWTVWIEAVIAVAFLWRGDRGPARIRNPALLVFMVSAYGVAPVPGFAALLAILGFANCRREETRARWLYLLAFLLVPYSDVPLRLFLQLGWLG